MEKQKKALAGWQKAGDNIPAREGQCKRLRKNVYIILTFKLLADEKDKIH